jgi:hypothetical protein
MTVHLILNDEVEAYKKWSFDLVKNHLIEEILEPEKLEIMKRLFTYQIPLVWKILQNLSNQSHYFIGIVF